MGESCNKVVVTGVSVCTPNGIGVKDFEKNSLRGVSGCDFIRNFDVPDGFGKAAGIIKNFYPETLFDYDKNYDLDNDRLQLLAEFCIDEALQNANLIFEKNKRKNISLYLSSAIGQMITMEKIFIKKNIKKENINNQAMKSFSFINLVNYLGKKFNINGVSTLIPTGCVGGCDAIGYAVNAIRSGKLECIITGAIESPITPLVVAAFGQIRANSVRKCNPTESSCPFDIQRDGFVLGEGAGILVLESEKSALERSAPILAEIKGVGSVNNCFHMTDINPDGKSIALSCRLAFNDANLSPNDISYINAHGSSTPQNDAAESNAFHDLFDRKLIENIPVTSIKSQIGHALSAANAIEIVSVVQSINNQRIPPTINLKKKDPKCNINVITEKLYKHDINNVLKTSSGFSGIHTALIVGKYEE